jgi:SAM-dependent methyltransferase
VIHPISLAVGQQYEDFPYPRWFDFNMGKQTALSERISRKFPFLHFPHRSQPEILIAGCGTGKHTLTVAFRHPESSVLSIDLSRASLAYAMRQAERYRIPKVEFLHGDLLLVNQLNRTFDWIETGGVLHHMESPAAGLEALARVLKPGGMLRVSVYSQRAMARFLDAQRLCLDLVAGDRSPGKLRQARQAMLEKFHSDPESFRCFEFFHTSGLPDVFCPVHAEHFTPAGLRQLFGKLDVEFVGFADLEEDVKVAYRQMYPNDPHIRDLDSIESFDREFPLNPGLKVVLSAKESCLTLRPDSAGNRPRIPISPVNFRPSR